VITGYHFMWSLIACNHWKGPNWAFHLHVYGR